MKIIEDIDREENQRLVDKLNTFKGNKATDYLNGYLDILQGIKSKEYIEGHKDAVEYLRNCYRK